MGRIKSLMIKKVASKVFDSMDGFGDNFENNKKLLNKALPYKSMRNRVAGAIVGLARKKKKKNDGRDEQENGRNKQES